MAFVNLYLRMDNFMVLDTFDYSWNAALAIRVVCVLYIRMRKCFLSYDSILGYCYITWFNILSPEMKFHFCQIDHNETTAVLSFISVYFM